MRIVRSSFVDCWDEESVSYQQVLSCNAVCNMKLYCNNGNERSLKVYSLKNVLIGIHITEGANFRF